VYLELRWEELALVSYKEKAQFSVQTMSPFYFQVFT